MVVHLLNTCDSSDDGQCNLSRMECRNTASENGDAFLKFAAEFLDGCKWTRLELTPDLAEQRIADDGVASGWWDTRKLVGC